MAYDPKENAYLVVWAHANGSDDDIRGRVVAADGNLPGAEITITAAAAEEQYPAVAANGAGGYVVAWQEGSSNADIAAAVVDRDGQVLGSGAETLSEAGNTQERPALSYDSDRGRYLVVWADHRNSPTGADVYGQILRDYTVVIDYAYDPLSRLVGAVYSTGVAFGYGYDRAGNRTALTETTPLSGTVVTTYTFDKANRLAARAVSDGRSYTYDWSDRGELLAENTQGVDVRTFAWDAAGRLTEATVFTLTTHFTYTGDGTRVAVGVAGVGVTEYIPDRGGRILVESTATTSTRYLYGRDCLGEVRDGTLLYYLADGQGYVRQSTDEDGAVMDAWLFTPDGGVMAGPQGPVSHLVCGGIYDWSTGLLYNGGRYFDPTLGIWLALGPLAVVQGWRERKKRKGRRGIQWYVLVALLVVEVGVGGVLVGCGPEPTPWPTPTPRPACIDFDPNEYFVSLEPTVLSAPDVVPILYKDIAESIRGMEDLFEFPGQMFQFGSPAYHSMGIELTGKANIPAGAEGDLYMVQYVRENNVRWRASGIQEEQRDIYQDLPGDTWFLDTTWYGAADPERGGLKHVKGYAENVAVSFPDAPGTMVAGYVEERDIVKVHMDEEFKTYLVFEGVESCGIPCACSIGVVDWGWDATAIRQVGPGGVPDLTDKWRVEVHSISIGHGRTIREEFAENPPDTGQWRWVPTR